MEYVQVDLLCGINSNPRPAQHKRYCKRALATLISQCQSIILVQSRRSVPESQSRVVLLVEYSTNSRMRKRMLNRHATAPIVIPNTPDADSTSCARATSSMSGNSPTWDREQLP